MDTRYEDALQRCKEEFDFNNLAYSHEEIRQRLEIVFPELRESEDEMIRKALISVLKSDFENDTTIHDISVGDIIAWLEKRSEQTIITDILIKAGLKPYKDGDKWCVLVGDNIQDGVCGFGDTIDEALFEFLKELTEKQSEQKPVISDNALREGIAHFGITQYQIDNWLKKYVDVEKQGEQKSTDKIEPKFKVGDKIIEKDFDECGCGTIVNIKDGKYIFDNGSFICIKEQELWEVVKEPVEPKFNVGDWVIAISSGNIFKILSVNDGLYRVLCHDGVEANYPIEDVDYDLAYWTIQDAKDGDVLVLETDEVDGVLIYKEIVTPPSSKGSHDLLRYYSLLADNHCNCDGVCDMVIEGYEEYLKPATKEQRNLLFQKMKEAGYEWDVDKKELRKIEQKPKEKTKFYDSMDDLIADALIKEIENSELDDKSKHNRIFWIKSHRQKPVWTGEDSCCYDDICEILINLIHSPKSKVNKDVVERDLNWIMSISNRIKSQEKPSWSEKDEEIFQKVKTAIDSYYAPFSRDAEEMSEWSKNLKDRVQPQPKQEWTEEDEQNLKGIINEIEANKAEGSEYDEKAYDMFLSWLKSIKERMKG